MIFLDTSVLVASLVSSHPHHGRALPLFDRITEGKIKAAVCVHNLAECYATLSAYPASPMLFPESAFELIHQNVMSHFEQVELSLKDYQSALERVVQLKLRSGAIYDALIWQAAVKKRVKTFYTWNPDDFMRFSDGKIAVREP